MASENAPPPKAHVVEDSFTVPAIGRQTDSQKDTMPAYSFGTGDRNVAQRKLYVSAKHEKAKVIMVSPGPVYKVPCTVGDAPKFGMGHDEQRKHPKAKYPDSSVDLTCATVDNQVFKYGEEKCVRFGTENRDNIKNAEVIRTNPALMLGMESPGGLEYSPEEQLTTHRAPEYSFGPKNSAPGGDGSKIIPRLPLPATGTPRHVGPGSHRQPSSLGAQMNSARSSAPSYGFGTEQRHTGRKEPKQLLDTNTDFSSLGRQVVSNAKSAPRHGFGSATRDQVAKTHFVRAHGDLGPVASLPKPNYPIQLPVHCPRGPAGGRPGL